MYNHDFLLDLVESLRQKSGYMPFLDLEFKSADFINVITDNIDFIELVDDDDLDNNEYDNEYYSYET
tara:strand:+ start:130 stop:330 length:201 start_codon:yes stop_codon:yes gene_type:complete